MKVHLTLCKQNRGQVVENKRNCGDSHQWKKRGHAVRGWRRRMMETEVKRERTSDRHWLDGESHGRAGTEIKPRTCPGDQPRVGVLCKSCTALRTGTQWRPVKVGKTMDFLIVHPMWCICLVHLWRELRGLTNIQGWKWLHSILSPGVIFIFFY